MSNRDQASALLWEFFGQRLKSRAAGDDDYRYEAFPYQFHGLEKELSKDAALAVSIVRRWYGEELEICFGFSADGYSAPLFQVSVLRSQTFLAS